LNLFLFGISTLVTLVLVVPIQLLLAPFDPLRKVAAAIGRWTWGIGMFGIQPFWRVTITGLERLEQASMRGGIVVANHQSMLDIPLLMHLPVQLRLLARASLRKMPVFGQMAALGHHVFVDPDNPQATLSACQRYLDHGIWIAIFPEGTRSDGVSMLPFARGAFELALQTQAPILPACIRGTSIALPKGSAFTRKFLTPFHLSLLPPIYPEADTGPGARRRLAGAVRGAMEVAMSWPYPWELSEKLKVLYGAHSRWMGGFAYGKTKVDPVFWALFERLPKEGRLLDLGCGEGFLGAYLRLAGSRLEILGIDHDPSG
jgi:1-acyl-sn-glycerol-3-phosphate acyltransferase